MSFQMNIFKKITYAALLTVAAIGAAYASEKGTPAEAEAMAHKAADFIAKHGPEKAYDVFTNDPTAFKDRDLYVAVVDFKGNILAQGGNPKLVGKNLMGFKDPDGVEFIKISTDVAIQKGKGWTSNYKFINPATKKIQTKATYIERVGDTWIGVGVYKD